MRKHIKLDITITAIIAAGVMDVVAVPIEVAFPGRGFVSVQIRDANGSVVGNVVNPAPLDKGQHALEWELTGPEDGVYALEGEYTYKAIFIPEHTLAYRGCFYPTPLPDGATPWCNGSGKGGWLADHFAPKSIVRVGDFMYLTAMCEAADGVIKCDKNLGKLWGTRQYVFNTPFTSAADGGFYYGWKNGFKKIDSVSNAALGVRTKANGGGGFAVIDGIAYVCAKDKVEVWDFHDGAAVTDQPLDEIAVADPTAIRRTAKKTLVLFSGNDIVALDPKAKAVTTLVKDAVKKRGGLAVREDGLLAAGDMETDQVILCRGGKGIARLGKGGKRALGAWDENTLEAPYGLEFGSDGRLWVCENDFNPKRVSVWNCETLKCEKAVVGPTQYGGGGCVDPEDAGRAFYWTLELKKGTDGKYRPAGVFFRGRTPECGPWGGIPTYAFRAKGRLWFTEQQNPMGNGGNVLYVYDEAKHVARAVAAIGNTDYLDFALKGAKEKNGSFAWTDLHDDGKLTEDEVRYFDGPKIGTGWVNRMNGKFEIAFDCGNSQVAKFSPESLTQAGYPVYGKPSLLPVPYVRAHHQQLSASSHLVDEKGNVVTLSKPLLSIAADGTLDWRYRNRWPSLHDSHETTENGRRLGELIGTTRFWGSARLNDDVGEVICFNSNLGCAYLMSADGIFLAQLMQDQRCGKWWGYNTIPDSDTLKQTSMQDEHFLGELQRTKIDGRDALVMVCGKTHASIIEIGGLEGAKRLKDGSFTVGAKDIAAVRSRLADEAAKNMKIPEYEVCDVPEQNVTDDGYVSESVWKGIAKGTGPDGDVFQLSHDKKNLYLRYQAKDAEFKNAGKDFATLFETGDAVDLMLQTGAKADEKRKTAAAGDIRFLFTEMAGKAVCVKYDYVNTKAKGEGRVFESPVGKLKAASVELRKDATVRIERGKGEFTLKAVVPLAALGNTDNLKATRGDIGRIKSDSTGAVSVERSYWSNKATMLMSDRPTQAGVDPRFWGKLKFTGKLSEFGIDF